MLPELDVFHAHGHQFVHPERIALHHKDLVFMTPADTHELSADQLKHVKRHANISLCTGTTVRNWELTKG